MGNYLDEQDIDLLDENEVRNIAKEYAKKLPELEGLIVKHKTDKGWDTPNGDTPPAPTEPKPTFVTEEDLRKRDFYAKNPHLTDIAWDIDKIVKAHNVDEDTALIILKSRDPSVANRQNTQNSSVLNTWTPEAGVRVYTADQIAQATTAQYEKMVDDVKAGKARWFQ